MDYKTICVHLDESKHCAGRLTLATSLAQQFGAYLVGLYATDPVSAPSVVGDSTYLVAQRSSSKKSEERALRAKSTFLKHVAGQGFDRAEFRALASGAAIETMITNARYADLLIIGQTDPDETETGVTASFPELLVLSSGRPMLVVPYYIDTYPVLGSNILVAWSATRESTRALTDALPFLKRANRVVVMSVNPEVSEEKHGDLPSADAALYLARHGVKVEAMQSWAQEIGVGDELLARAADMEIDLLVAGAYGHSRIREIVLGGVTQTLLRHMTVPVLMAH
jgi:nucleotide-binding universal stress UspA family protein